MTVVASGTNPLRAVFEGPRRKWFQAWKKICL